jgi:Dyp-type peroxidase family
MARPGRRHEMSLEEIQSHILRSMDPDRSVLIFFRIAEVTRFRKFLAALLPPELRHSPASDDPAAIESAASPRLWSEAHQATSPALPADHAAPLPPAARMRRRISWNVAFTWPGLRALAIETATLESFPVEFQEGMARRAQRLGDVGESAPENWEGWLGSPQIHGLLWVNLRADAGKRPDALDPQVEQVIAGLGDGRYGFDIVQHELGCKIVDDSGRRIEHFGFRDGISQPFAAVDFGLPAGATPRLTPPLPGGGTPRPKGAWAPIAHGELLLGHHDEDGLVQMRPDNVRLRHNGTYLVFRKLEQDVLGFRRYIAEREGKPFGRDSRLAAQMFGRWPDGTSLVEAPDAPPARPPADTQINDFRYGRDPQGERCPIGAHVRRVNPRDTNARDEPRRHRIWRRGLSYGGDFIPPGSSGDGKPRGLLFMAFNARIDQQFEFLQSRWLNAGEFMGQAGAGRCPILGAHSGGLEDAFFVPGRPGPYSHLPRFVKVRGGDYFFVPSLLAVAAMADGYRFPPEKRSRDPYVKDAPNPAIDATPKPLDVDALLSLGEKKLLPPAAKPVYRHQGLVLVGRYDEVCSVLEDDHTYGVDDYDERIREITAGRPLIVGMTHDDPARVRRLRLWRRAAGGYTGPSIAEIVGQEMAAVLARAAPTGRLDLVKDVGEAAALALARRYYGVLGPSFLSPTWQAAYFAKTALKQVPADWLAALPTVAEQDWPDMTLATWLYYPFVHIFENVVNDQTVATLARNCIDEMFPHLQQIVGAAVEQHRDSPGAAALTTLLSTLATLEAKEFDLDEDQFIGEICLLLAEFMSSGLRTLSQALANIVDQLLVDQRRLEGARKWARRSPANDRRLDGVIREALRFDPFGPVLFRRCRRTAKLGDATVKAGESVCLLVKTAMFDPREFADPEKFVATRPAGSYLHFGPQPLRTAPHRCIGADPTVRSAGAGIAVEALREMLRPLLALEDLRLAAGPAAQQRDAFGKRVSCVIRFRPSAIHPIALARAPDVKRDTAGGTADAESDGRAEALVRGESWPADHPGPAALPLPAGAQRG